MYIEMRKYPLFEQQKRNINFRMFSKKALIKSNKTNNKDGKTTK
ncbi:hypothetical protein DOY81_006351 [Sarcophaga bullata]|nr:hypothetical protein DOY81_006351 [Sarcophaga bullata]